MTNDLLWSEVATLVNKLLRFAEELSEELNRFSKIKANLKDARQLITKTESDLTVLHDDLRNDVRELLGKIQNI